jgi:hypothetical protein
MMEQLCVQVTNSVNAYLVNATMVSDSSTCTVETVTTLYRAHEESSCCENSNESSSTQNLTVGTYHVRTYERYLVL